MNNVENYLKGNGRTITGSVISNKMDKTIVVQVKRRVQHPIYEKVVERTSKMHAHDEKNECTIGDEVVIKECRPISKKKTWCLVEVLKKATAEE